MTPVPWELGRLRACQKDQHAMTGRQRLDVISIAERNAPALVADVVQPYDVRLEDLLQGQQDVLDLVLGGASLQDVIVRIVSVIEAAFAPARAVISLFQRGGRAVRYQAAPNLPVELVSTVGAFVG